MKIGGVFDQPVWKSFSIDELANEVTQMEGPSKIAIRNNNPGNLKDTEGNFIKFDTMEEGRAALKQRLRNWQRRFPDMTIEQFNQRYSPDKGAHKGDNPPGTEEGRNKFLRSYLKRREGL